MPSSTRRLGRQGKKKVSAVTPAQSQPQSYQLRPFVACGLPIRRPAPGVLVHERRNGSWRLRIEGSPTVGLPFGQDRAILIFLASAALSASSPRIDFAPREIVEWLYARHVGGREYDRLVVGLRRIAGATVVFAQESGGSYAERGYRLGRFLRVWRESEAAGSATFEFGPDAWDELRLHPVPLSLEVVRKLAARPLLLDLAWWISWRAHERESFQPIPIIGEGGLCDQLGSPRGLRPHHQIMNLRNELRRLNDLGCLAYPVRIEDKHLILEGAPKTAKQPASRVQPEMLAGKYRAYVIVSGCVVDYWREKGETVRLADDEAAPLVAQGLIAPI